MNREHIIAEKLINDKDKAIALAEEMITESIRIWSSDGWKREKNRRGVVVESKKVSGIFAKSGILIMRSKGIIKASAEDVFELLTCPKGYAILDPVSNPEDHKKPLLAEFEWKNNSRLEVAHADVNNRFIPKAEFVVLNATDYNNMIFVSKSIVHPKHPGSSIFYKEAEEKLINTSGITRALNTMAIKVREISKEESELLVLNYIDMGIGIGKGTWLYNLINRNFFGPLYKRIKKNI